MTLLFSSFLLVFLPFSWFFLQFYWISWVFLGFIEFRWVCFTFVVFLHFSWVCFILLGFIESYRVCFSFVVFFILYRVCSVSLCFFSFIGFFLIFLVFLPWYEKFSEIFFSLFNQNFVPFLFPVCFCELIMENTFGNVVVTAERDIGRELRGQYGHMKTLRRISYGHGGFCTTALVGICLAGLCVHEFFYGFLVRLYWKTRFCLQDEHDFTRGIIFTTL